MDKYKPQVNKNHYKNRYESLERFISYYYQIDAVKKVKPKEILEIGIGNKTVSNYLKQQGYNIETCDFDKALDPDHVADIRRLPFADNAYDCIVACQILEHLEWDDFEIALNELNRIARNTVIISIPYDGFFFELIINIKLPFFSRHFKKTRLNSLFRVPYFFRERLVHPEHKWEMGYKDYSIRKIRKELLKKFLIHEEFSPLMHPYHYFFILKKFNQ